jgi:hypothetical protein
MSEKGKAKKFSPLLEVETKAKGSTRERYLRCHDRAPLPMETLGGGGGWGRWGWFVAN